MMRTQEQSLVPINRWILHGRQSLLVFVAKRGQDPLVRGTLRAVPEKGSCPLFANALANASGYDIARHRNPKRKRGRPSCPPSLTLRVTISSGLVPEPVPDQPRGRAQGHPQAQPTEAPVATVAGQRSAGPFDLILFFDQLFKHAAHERAAIFAAARGREVAPTEGNLLSVIHTLRIAAETTREDPHQAGLQFRPHLAQQAEQMGIAGPGDRSSLAEDGVDPILEHAHDAPQSVAIWLGTAAERTSNRCPNR